MAKILTFIHDSFEDLEYWYPLLRLKEAGHTVITAGEKAGAKYSGKHGVPAEADIGFGEISPEEYDGAVVPGGWAPDKLRRYEPVLEAIRALNEAGKPIGHICHAGWVLASAGIMKGVETTSTPGIKDDLIHAGATWKDAEVVVDGNIVSSRRPPDLPAYMREFLKQLQ
jgi:protease I